MCYVHIHTHIHPNTNSGAVYSLTFVKEGDVVILHRSEVHILPKIRLLRGVRRQKALSVESLL